MNRLYPAKSVPASLHGPQAVELVEAAAEFLSREVLDQTRDDRLRFRLRVAINALHIASRDLRADGGELQALLSGVAALLHEGAPLGAEDPVAWAQKALSREIRNGVLHFTGRDNERSAALVSILRTLVQYQLRLDKGGVNG